MARTPAVRPAFALPRNCTIIKGGPSQFWDVKFYPYLVEPDDPTIFAVVGSFVVHVCQLTCEENSRLRVIATYSRDEDRLDTINSINCCTWCYIEQDDPLLAIAGESGHVQVIKPMTSELSFTLVGHGVGTVNDLATHPIYPWIIASASIDGSIRIWDLRRASNKALSTCVVICGHSLAHKEGLLSISWHDCGRYLVSGGFDHKICVWTVPDFDPQSSFWHEISQEGRKRSSDEVRIIYYPHFISAAIHAEYVDAVMFWDDFVLSKAAKEHKIVLWRITGFNSALPPPPTSTAPKSQEHLETRNGFMRTARVSIDDDVFEDENEKSTITAPFSRLLEFKNEHSTLFYMRFGLLRPNQMFPDLHTVLSAGDTFSKLRHWDLERLISGYGTEPQPSPFATAAQRSKGTARPISKDSSTSSREPSAVFSASEDPREGSTGATSLSSEQLRLEQGQRQRNREKHQLHDFEKGVQHHAQNDESNNFAEFRIRGVAWSVCGRWCVAVGEAPTPGRGGLLQGVIQIVER